MKQVHIRAEVHGIHEPKFPTVYRFFVNEDLITERTYQLEHGHCIDEFVIANLEEGQHSIRIEPVNYKYTGTFDLKNIRINHEQLHPGPTKYFEFFVSHLYPDAV